MEIKREQITVKELVDGYKNDGESGVVGYGGKLDIRPPFQREFIYNDEKRNLVIDTILKGFPLNIMYWTVKDDETFEVLDGQQRTISIGEYVFNAFSIDGHFFNNQPDDKQKQILDYKLDVYKCEGTHSEKLEWFKTINIAGEVLRPQEILNAIYAGKWTADAKKQFSKTRCPAFGIGSDFMNGAPIRQDYLETVLKWISNNKIKEYMGKHQHDKNADELWNYYESVIKWVRAVFVGNTSDIRNEMKSVAWGELYNNYKDEKLDSKAIQKEVSDLMQDDDIQKSIGIYTYVLTRDEKNLSIRAFKDKDKRKVFEKQRGICIKCKKKFEIEKMEADHIKPWSQGGKTEMDNCQMLCKSCNRRKSDT